MIKKIKKNTASPLVIDLWKLKGPNASRTWNITLNHLFLGQLSYLIQIHLLLILITLWCWTKICCFFVFISQQTNHSEPVLWKDGSRIYFHTFIWIWNGSSILKVVSPSWSFSRWTNVSYLDLLGLEDNTMSSFSNVTQNAELLHSSCPRPPSGIFYIYA